MFVFPHGLSRRPRRQRLGDRRPRQGRQGPAGVQVQPGRQGADDARQGGRRRQRPRQVQRAVRRAGRAERRHLRRRRPWRQHQRAHREVRQERQVHQDVGQQGHRRRASSTSRTRWRSIRAAGCSSPTATTTASRSSTRTASFLDPWTQFGRPSGIYIDKNDMLYVADSESESVAKNHDGWKRGIRIGSASDGSVTAFIPDPVEQRHDHQRRRRRRGRRAAATSTAPKSARSG